MCILSMFERKGDAGGRILASLLPVFKKKHHQPPDGGKKIVDNVVVLVVLYSNRQYCQH